MHIHRIVPVALVAVLACAGPELDTRTFEIRHADAYRLAEAVEPYVFTDRERNPGRMSVASGMLSVRETPDNLSKIERLIKEYDRPLASVRLHFKVIEADGVARADTSIADVEQELRRLFRFRGYRLLGEAVLAGVEGSAMTQVVSPEVGIRAAVRGVRGRGDSATVLLEVTLLPLEALQTVVTAPVGKTIVLGNAMGERGGALIVTVRPELVK